MQYVLHQTFGYILRIVTFSVIRYDNLVSSGFTSPVMAGCLLDRNMTDAMTIATDLRWRHDGRNRSPWNEPECGLLYSRAMAHWNIFDQVTKPIAPRSRSRSRSVSPFYLSVIIKCS